MIGRRGIEATVSGAQPFLVLATPPFCKNVETHPDVCPLGMKCLCEKFVEWLEVDKGERQQTGSLIRTVVHTGGYYLLGALCGSRIGQG